MIRVRIRIAQVFPTSFWDVWLNFIFTPSYTFQTLNNNLPHPGGTIMMILTMTIVIVMTMIMKMITALLTTVSAIAATTR
jgi:hypothetical protein